MAENETKVPPVNTSGWTGEEIAMLRMMVREDGTDASKFIRGLIRKEYTARQRKTWKNIKAHVVGNKRTTV